MNDALLKDDKENESGAVVSGDGINPLGLVTLDLEITDGTLACKKKKGLKTTKINFKLCKHNYDRFST